MRPTLVDAIRISDNKRVYIKRLPTDSEELKIALLLGSETAIKDPKNHSVAVFDHFEDPNDPSTSYMVMPFLRPINDPPFETVRDVVDFVDQMLEVSALDKV